MAGPQTHDDGIYKYMESKYNISRLSKYKSKYINN